MNIQKLGYAIRQARENAGLTQAKLASEVNLSRTTLNQLENGVFPDIGVKKLLALLHHLGKELAVVKPSRQTHPNFVRMARIAANVSYKETLTEEELIHAIFPHPTLSEAMHESVLSAYGRVIHI